MHKIYIAADHGGFNIKQDLITALSGNGYTVHDLGTQNSTDSVDYPTYADAVADKLHQDTDAFGVLVCGSGVGISIAANRHKHIRCALVSTPEIASLSRNHNNANVIALGGRFIDTHTAIETVHAFLTATFEGNRHKKRISMLS